MKTGISYIIGKNTRFDDMGEFCINWQNIGDGFGLIVFTLMNNGEVYINSEDMDKEFIKKVLCNLVDNAILKDE